MSDRTTPTGTDAGHLRRVLSANLMAHKQKQNLTVEQLGYLSGLGKNTVQRALHGDSSASVDTIEALARALKVDPARLLAAPRTP